MRFTLIVVGFVAVLVIWILLQPRLEVELDKDSPMTLKLKTANINHLLQIEYFSMTKSEPIWSVNTKNELPDKITFGRIPKDCAQTFPPKSAMPREIRDKEEFFVRVHYQYDSLFPLGAASNSKKFFFVNENGKLRKNKGAKQNTSK